MVEVRNGGDEGLNEGGDDGRISLDGEADLG